MARDFGFWKEKQDVQRKNSDIYNDLSNGKYLDYINEIPLEHILQDIVCEFAEWNRSADFYFEKQSEAFELYLTKQFVRVDCYSMTEQNINKIIDVLLKYDCPLYDAAIDVRFDGKE